MKRMMIAAALTALGSPAAANASSWYLVGGNDHTLSYVDLDSLRPIGGKIIALTESVYAEPLNGEVRAGTIRSEYDCSGGYFRTLEYTYYADDGSLITTEASNTINEHKVPKEGSIDEAIMQFVCYRKGGEQIADPVAYAKAQFGIK